MKALRRRGHDALMVPVYLPLHGEDREVDGEIFLGGINVYLQQKSSLFRHTPRWLDRWFDRPALLRRAAGFAAMTSARELGAVTCATLRGEEGPQRKEFARLGDWLAREEHPDVVVLSNALLISFADTIKRRTNARVVCSLQGEDTFLDGLPEPFRSEAWASIRRMVSRVDVFVSISDYYRDQMNTRLGLSAGAAVTVHNGIDIAGYAEVRRGDDGATIGYLSQLVPKKGLSVLVDAFLAIRRQGVVPHVRLHVAGATVPGLEAYVDGERTRVAAAGAADDVLWRANLDRGEKIGFLRGLSVFCVPATYGESFGLYVLEAMAAGVPVVQPNHAAFPEIVGLTGGGVLYDPADRDEPARSLTALLGDAARRRELGEAGRVAVARHFSADAMADKFERLLTANAAVR